MRTETQARSVRVKGLSVTLRVRGKSWDLICFMVKMQWQVVTPVGNIWVPLSAPASLIGSSLFLQGPQTQGIAAYGL